MHVEATKHLQRCLDVIRRGGARAGAVLNPATPASALESAWPDLDYVVVMSVNPGRGGQPFLPQAVEERLRRHDPVLHGSFCGASLELTQRLIVLPKAHVDEREIERIDVSALPSYLLEAAENRAGILTGACRAEDGARVATPDRVPGSRGERPMHEADSLL